MTNNNKYLEPGYAWAPYIPLQVSPDMENFVDDLFDIKNYLIPPLSDAQENLIQRQKYVKKYINKTRYK